MSLRSEAKRVEIGTQINGLFNVATSVTERLNTLKTQFADIRVAIATNPDLGQTELAELDALVAQMRQDVKDFALTF